MRLSLAQRETIRTVAAQVAGPLATMRLFGSRLSAEARGGDIDLLVDGPGPASSAFDLSLRLGARLERALGGRKVDVIVAPLGQASDEPIVRVARAQGVLL